MELLRSTLIRAPHAFPTRHGGVSTGPFDSLNLSASVGDRPDAVAENLGRLGARFGVAPAQVRTAEQVHGTTVLDVAQPDGASAGEGDGLVTATPGLVGGVRTADCLPILIEDRRTGQVAAVHAGWRGVIGEIVVRAVERLVSRGAEVGTLYVALGPAIQACCFEVGGDLPERFAARFGDDVVVRPPRGERPHVDLPRAVRRSLERAGVPQSHVDVLPHCTACEARFFSHRRDQGRTGRHLSVIQCVGETRL